MTYTIRQRLNFEARCEDAIRATTDDGLAVDLEQRHRCGLGDLIDQLAYTASEDGRPVLARRLLDAFNYLTGRED